MNNDLISREALKKAVEKRIWYIAPAYDEIMAIIDNAPTVDIKDQIAGAYNEGYACGSRENEKPQGERAERALAIIDRLRTDGHINNREQGTLRRAILLPEKTQGEWIVTAEDNDGVHRICCPFCFYEKGSNNTDAIVVTFTNFPKFCENCGADMRKGGAE